MSNMPFQQPRVRLLDHDWFAWLVLMLMLSVTIGLWQLSEHQVDRRSHDRFLHLANKEGNVILTRMQAYERVLRGAASLFAASVHVSREEWRAYIEPLELSLSMPGMLGTGFAVAIPPDELDNHEQEIRAEGFSSYKVFPLSNNGLTTSIIYLEPFDQRNRRAFGYDMFSNPVRRAAMERARDSGMAALSSKVILLQETNTDVQPGFLMYLPVYRNDSEPEDIKSRRAALYGFVYSPFRASDLMNGILGPSERDLELELFDGEPLDDNLLYSSGPTSLADRYMTDVEIEIAGRIWTARVHSNQSFENSIPRVQPMLILAAGTGLDFALFAMLLFNARYRRRMLFSAVALEQSRDSFRTLVENVPGTVFRSQAEAPWDIVHISPGIETLIGEPLERFECREISPRQFTHADDISMVEEAIKLAISDRETYSIEYRICKNDMSIRWVTERGRASYNTAGLPQWLDGVILDVTDRKIAELAIRDLAFYDPLTGLPNRRLLSDRLKQQFAITHRTNRYSALLFIDMDNFKSINDTLGHDAGDALLVEVASRLLSNVRETDTVTRLGGDEFVLILADLSNDNIDAIALAKQVGTKLINALNQPYQLGDQSRCSTPSIGITTYRGHKATVEELLRQADQAMYSAKSAGRNCLMVYEAPQK